MKNLNTNLMDTIANELKDQIASIYSLVEKMNNDSSYENRYAVYSSISQLEGACENFIGSLAGHQDRLSIKMNCDRFTEYNVHCGLILNDESALNHYKAF